MKKSGKGCVTGLGYKKGAGLPHKSKSAKMVNSGKAKTNTGAC